MLTVRRDPLCGALQYAQPTPVMAEGRAWFDLRDVPDDLPERIRRDDLGPDTLHAACFVGYLALEMGVASPAEVLGDYGLVHEAVHGAAFQRVTDTVGGSPCSLTLPQLADLADDLRRRVLEGIEDLERRVPRDAG